MILVDSNVPMYLVGADHPNKITARSVLELAVARRERLVTDAEVIQEILHRYAAIDRRTFIEPAIDALLGVVDEVYPIELEDVNRARDIVLSSWLTARDAIHVAIMQRHGIAEIMTFDGDFADVPGIAIRPLPDDPIGAAAGSLAGPGPTGDEMRRQWREEELEAERRKQSRRSSTRRGSSPS